MPKSTPAAKARATRAAPARSARKAPVPARMAKPAATARAPEDVAQDYLEQPDPPETVRVTFEELLDDDQASASLTQQLIYHRMETHEVPPRKTRKQPSAKPAASVRPSPRGKNRSR